MAALDDIWAGGRPPVPPKAPNAPLIQGINPNTIQQTPKLGAVKPVDSCIIEGLQKAGLTSLIAAVKQSGAEVFNHDSGTILAPTNAAFASLETNLAAWSPELLSAVLEYHSIEGVYTNKRLQEGVPDGLISNLEDARATEELCDGADAKVTIDVHSVGSNIVFEGGSTSVDNILPELMLCDGNFSVVPIPKLLLPCCTSMQQLLQGRKGISRPLLVGNTSSSVSSKAATTSGSSSNHFGIFQEALLALATSAQVRPIITICNCDLEM